jgi:bifunctional DNA-binding transcriptional regulator/antitoxin component of YhaV-PrlF toxin-antitoxin module
MKLQESKGKYSVFLPASIVKAMDWIKGDPMECKIIGKGRIEIRKAETNDLH